MLLSRALGILYLGVPWTRHVAIVYLKYGHVQSRLRIQMLLLVLSMWVDSYNSELLKKKNKNIPSSLSLQPKVSENTGQLSMSCTIKYNTPPFVVLSYALGKQ